MLRLVFLAVIVVIVIAVYFVSSTILDKPLKDAQGVAMARFGEPILNLCQKPTKARSTPPSDAKLSIINSVENTIIDEYNSALPAELQAKDKTDISVVACAHENQTVFDTDDYGNPPKYTCTRY